MKEKQLSLEEKFKTEHPRFEELMVEKLSELFEMIEKNELQVDVDN